ncbi:MAG TPA: tetratricopeptide repeat protein [Thermoanaerobaculia bacterium]
MAAVALLHAPLVSAQEWRGGNARVEGNVKSEKGDPIEGAKVSLRWGRSSHGGPDLQTDKKGHWAILGLAGGSWNVDIGAAGYQTKKISVSLSETTRNPSVEIRLEPEVAQVQAREEILVGGRKISTDAAAALEAGNAALERKDYAAAREHYLKALPELPDNTALLMRIALAFEGDDKPDEALYYARQVIEKEPENLNARLTVAGIELERGHLDAAKDALSRVPEEKFTDSMYLNMGIIMFNKSNLPAAEDYFSKAIAKKADVADAYYFRGLTRTQGKRAAEAKADFLKYLELEPSGKEAGTVKAILETLK